MIFGLLLGGRQRIRRVPWPGPAAEGLASRQPSLGDRDICDPVEQVRDPEPRDVRSKCVGGDYRYVSESHRQEIESAAVHAPTRGSPDAHTACEQRRVGCRFRLDFATDHERYHAGKPA